MTVKVITMGAGNHPEHVLDMPKELTIIVTRDDGYTPSQPEIYTALTIALESMTKQKRKTKK